MNSGLHPAARKLCAPAKLLSTASVNALVDSMPGAGFPRQRMHLDAITVDTTDRKVSGQKGICVQWR